MILNYNELVTLLEQRTTFLRIINSEDTIASNEALSQLANIDRVIIGGTVEQGNEHTENLQTLQNALQKESDLIQNFLDNRTQLNKTRIEKFFEFIDRVSAIYEKILGQITPSQTINVQITTPAQGDPLTIGSQPVLRAEGTVPEDATVKWELVQGGKYDKMKGRGPVPGKPMRSMGLDPSQTY
tara:strand:- start:10094 stop:10645 length:552 start_codon:yes stop_codon:yes gene_type:complete